MALDTEKREYVLRTKRWDAATGKADVPQDELIHLTNLRERQTALVTELAEVAALIADVEAFVAKNPIAPEPVVVKPK